MRFTSDRSCSNTQCLRFSRWYSISLFACYLVFVISCYGSTTNEPATSILQVSPGATDSGSAFTQQTANSSDAAVGVVNLSANSANLSFGNVTVGSTVTLPVTVTATGTAPLTINSVTIHGVGFRMSQVTLPLTLNPLQSASFQVQSSTLTTGAISGTLIITSNSPTNPVTSISLTSTGVARTNPQLVVSAVSLNFGQVTVGSTASLPVTVTSTGKAPLTISSLAIDDPSFTLSGATFPLTLNPKQTLILNVTFTPLTKGIVTGTLMIRSNALRHARTTIHLTSTGVPHTSPQLVVSPVSLNFGNVKIGSTVTLPVTLTSTGTAPLTISSQTIVGAGYTVSGATFPLTLNPQQTVTLLVTFAPRALSRALGTLTINSSAARRNGASINLTSTGVAPPPNPQLAVTSTSLNFGTVNDGSSVTLPVTLTSTGTTPLTINSATINGTGFTVSGATFPVTLNPSLGITLMVQFSPTAGVPAAGGLKVSSNSSTGSSTVVSLSGTGQYIVDLNWDAPSSSPDPVASYAIYRSIGSSASYQLLNSVPDNQTTYIDNSVQSGIAYNYRVKSVDSVDVESAPSNTASVTIP